ncbi:MAG TPA: hypothetical protein VFY12_14145 [Arenimonas sp.]|nr:hypothetical protein [Arenimonas sp.]
MTETLKRRRQPITRRRWSLLSLAVTGALLTACTIKIDPEWRIEDWQVQKLPSADEGNPRFRLTSTARMSVTRQQLSQAAGPRMRELCKHDDILAFRLVEPAYAPDVDKLEQLDLELDSGIPVTFELTCPGRLPNEMPADGNGEFKELLALVRSRVTEIDPLGTEPVIAWHTWTREQGGRHQALRESLGREALRQQARCGNRRVVVGPIATAVRIDPLGAYSDSRYRHKAVPPLDEYDGRLDVFAAARFSCFDVTPASVPSSRNSATGATDSVALPD